MRFYLLSYLIAAATAVKPIACKDDCAQARVRARAQRVGYPNSEEGRRSEIMCADDRESVCEHILAFAGSKLVRGKSRHASYQVKKYPENVASSRPKFPGQTERTDQSARL